MKLHTGFASIMKIMKNIPLFIALVQQILTSSITGNVGYRLETIGLKLVDQA